MTTKLALATENAALRAQISQLSNDLMNSEARVKRLHIIIGRNSNKLYERGEKLSFAEASAIARKSKRTVQDVMHNGA